MSTVFSYKWARDECYEAECIGSATVKCPGDTEYMISKLNGWMIDYESWAAGSAEEQTWHSTLVLPRHRMIWLGFWAALGNKLQTAYSISQCSHLVANEIAQLDPDVWWINRSSRRWLRIRWLWDIDATLWLWLDESMGIVQNLDEFAWKWLYHDIWLMNRGPRCGVENLILILYSIDHSSSISKSCTGHVTSVIWKLSRC